MTATDAKKAAAQLGEIIKFLPQSYEADVDLKTLQDWPGNPKDHDIGAIVESMRENGVYGAVRVQTSSRRILGGHGTREALRRLKVKRVNVLWIDCDDATGARIVAADNRITELGGYNDALLLDYLRAQQEQGNLKGTGYDDDDVTTLYQHLTGDYSQTWTGMPEYQVSDERSYHHLTVHFENDEAIAAFAKLLGREITLKTHYFWYPEQVRKVHADKTYVESDDAAAQDDDENDDDEDA
jgi:hypothetical protein